MRRILIIITTALVPYGGLATVMMNFYRKIDKNKFHIDFASTNNELDKDLYKELRENGSCYYSLGDRKKHLFRYIQKLNDVFKNNNYDVVHINSNSATAFIELFIAEKNGVKKRIVHNHTSICDHRFLHMILYPFFKKSYTDAIAVSEKAGKWIFKDRNYQIINNGIDTEKYRFSMVNREKIRKLYNINEKTTVLGHVGKIYKPKNHHFIISVFNDYHAQNPDSKLLLVGDGIMREEIEKDVNERGLKQYVIFAGMQKEPAKYLSAMDLFLFPSIWEGMPLSVIEAQASGIPCFISDTIDKSVSVTDNVERLSINIGTSVWLKALIDIKMNDRCKTSEKCIRMIKQAGFDSKTNAFKLEQVYLS